MFPVSVPSTFRIPKAAAIATVLWEGNKRACTVDEFGGVGVDGFTDVPCAGV